jgi:hypothetical protein
MERRNFVKNISAGGAAMLIAPSLFALEDSLKADTGMPGGLTPFILFEDCVKIILTSGQFRDNIKDALKGNIRKPLTGNISRMAGVMPGGEEHITALLNQLAKASNKNDIKWHDEKLSFALGWIIQKACSKDIVAYNRKLLKKDHRIEEIRIYQDTQVIRSRFGKQDEIALTPDNFSSLMMEYIVRVITRIHTLTPDVKNGGEWIVRVVGWREQNRKTMDQYGAVFAKPDPSKLSLYVQKCNFYNPVDPLILNGFQVADIAKKNTGMYSRAIVNGYNAMTAVQSFMDGKGDMESITRLL